ncbi:hypothetical protein Mal4_38790 [Maioricimonas rarisocia]|uniref:Uncharacterized protein n=1 Tax=Maioricimonas rarisocia TaxID=2528026 RepID=A0A517ZAL8_9PLAN|nr:hypothetical protein [Maioricimonas rarisocia]QDU39534.1 hypothetical protein Mal4_38790 [Maioricimonas rarisocia]
MSTTAPLHETAARVSSPSPDTAGPQWIVSPAFDLLFLMNVLWPVAFWIGYEADLIGHSALQFWQIYFVTTPHRWITLLLVAGDPARFGERPRLFIGLALGIVGGCLLVQSQTGALTCLLAVDYIWNAWHFASQHDGIYRIYSRRADRGVAPGAGQSWLFRLSIIYVIVRVAGWSWQFDALDETLSLTDFAVGGLFLAMLLWEWCRPRRSWGRSGYFTSVILLYLALLQAVHFHRPDMVLVLATASALFHATEYLAIVGWNITDRERKQQARGLIRKLAPMWAISVLMFALALGVAGWYADQHWLKAWLTINVMVAFLHYAWDGLIWKRRPAVR